jgi:hypothetical protein
VNDRVSGDASDLAGATNQLLKTCSEETAGIKMESSSQALPEKLRQKMPERLT